MDSINEDLVQMRKAIYCRYYKAKKAKTYKIGLS